jgi:hypothetical protein
MRIQEAITMEIKETLITEGKAKEAVMDDDSEPWDMEDRAYKEWREEPQTFGGREDDK